MQGYQERYVYFLPNHHKNTVVYIQIYKSSISHPLFYQSRSMQGVISKNYLNFVTILSNITHSQKSKFLSSYHISLHVKRLKATIDTIQVKLLPQEQSNNYLFSNNKIITRKVASATLADY